MSSDTEKVIDLIRAERERQVSAEGWTPEHDDEHDDGSLALAASCYVNGSTRNWPWEASWWKPKSRKRDLIRAAALLVAELERLERAND